MNQREFEKATRMPKPNTDALLKHALAGARGEFPEIKKNRKATIKMKNGGQYSYYYADLADIFNVINPVLAAYGLSVWQEPDGDKVVTTIMHEAGGEKSARWPIKPMPQRDLQDAQSFQSAVQVAKRYALQSALGISTEETIEGDPKAHRKTGVQINDNFEDGDGVRMPKGAKYDKDATPRKRAEEAARAIQEMFKEPKTIVGLNGVWNRNEMFIDKFRDKHPDLFSEVYDAFAAAEAMFNEAEAAE